MSQSFFFKNIRVICPSSPFHLKRIDLLIEHGSITRMGYKLSAPLDANVVEASRWSVSVGWCDLRAVVCEPGLEEHDDIPSLCRSAIAGGFTDVATLPNTQPVVQHKETITFLKTKAAFYPVSLHPIAALTQDTKGEDLAELYDLHQGGAIAFSDGLKSTRHEGVLLRALQYVQPFDGLIINLPSLAHIGKGGQMHEGVVSVRLGMKGIPSLTETMAIQRDIALLDYTGGKIHFTCISSKEGVELIRQAKAKGYRVTCDVAAHHLLFTDENLTNFDTTLKVRPPFRSEADKAALWQGIADNTIDAICTNHHPLSVEAKELEFDEAEPGMLALETAFSAICMAKPDYIGI
ncbi:MAG: dihydroorotase, partial [Flammeovirgaceae bacterium]|nr:dihydroorotase [Flammeovirgaceae bacterium]